MSAETVAALEVVRHPSGAIGLNIFAEDDDGGGTGYRICGPKMVASGAEVIRRHVLTERDAAEIRQHLDRIFPEGTDG